MCIFFASDFYGGVIYEVEPGELVLSIGVSELNPSKNLLVSDIGVVVRKLSSTLQTVQTSRNYTEDCVAVFPMPEAPRESRTTWLQSN